MTSGAQSLGELMEAIAERRDRLAFTRLYDHFAPRLKAYMLRLGCKDVVAEELAQEVMLVVWQQAASFDPRRASVITWIFTIARNRRIDVLRRERKMPLRSDLMPDVGYDPGDPETCLDAGEREASVRQAITELPRSEADLIRLVYYAGKSHSRVAEEQGLPLGTVKSRLRRALARLRVALQKER
jgi:RNA polymerase sigma factor (sigma-70 family)